MKPLPIASVALLAMLLTGTSSHARKVEDQYAGRVIVIKRRAPARFRNNSAFASFLRRNRLKAVMSKTTQDGEQWRIEFMAFFKKPLRDVEVKVRFYDITEGRQFVAADSVFHSARGQRILSSSFELKQPDFRGNRQYLMYVLNARNVVLAQTRFRLVGKRKRYSGRVVFSDEEVKGP